MKRLFLLPVLLVLSACKEDVAQDVTAVPLTQEAVGHYCQMGLLEHPGPKAQAHLGGLPGTPLFFSQVRDVVAYMRMPEQSHDIVAVWVNDMGAPGASWETPGIDNWIAAQDAVYVIGARVVGGMGAPELVPFADSSDAAEFVRLNGGQVMSLDDIPDSAVLAPVELTPETDDTDFENRLRVLSQELGE